jgi:hypothetical protein
MLNDFEMSTLNAALLNVESAEDARTLARMVMKLTSESRACEDVVIENLEEQLLVFLITEERKREQPTFQNIYKCSVHKFLRQGELLSVPDEVFGFAVAPKLQECALIELEFRLVSFRLLAYRTGELPLPAMLAQKQS